MGKYTKKSLSRATTSLYQNIIWISIGYILFVPCMGSYDFIFDFGGLQAALVVSNSLDKHVAQVQ